jgi:hypothetical protein
LFETPAASADVAGVRFLMMRIGGLPLHSVFMFARQIPAIVAVNWT